MLRCLFLQGLMPVEKAQKFGMIGGWPNQSDAADWRMHIPSPVFAPCNVSKGCSAIPRRASSRSCGGEKTVCGACGTAHRTWYDRRRRRVRDLPCADYRPSHGERSEGEEPAGPAMRPAMGVGPGGWPQATCKDTGRAAGNVDTPSSHGGRASCAPETGHAAGNERTARPRDGRGRAEAGAEAQRVRLKTEGARATGIMVWLPTP